MAEVATNPLDSTSLAVETPVNIDTAIYMLNPDDLPMMGGVNSDGYPLVGRKPVDQTVFYWLQDEFLIPRTTLQTTLADGVGTAVVLPTDQGERFAAGDLILIESEAMLITGMGGAGGDTATVTRGAAGTVAAAHTAGKEIIGLGTMLAEGAIGDEQFTGRTKLFNYTKIWTSKISITRTGRAIPKYGMPGGELPRQTMKVLLAEGVNMEQVALYGPRYQSGTVRHTGGLNYFLTTNRIANGTSGNWLTVTEIQNRQQVAYDAGGMFTDIIANAAAFQALTNLTTDRVSQIEMTDQRRGRVRATVVTTEFGDVMLHRNRYAKKTDAFGVIPEALTYRVFQPMVMLPLAKTDDKDNFMFVAEGGFQVKAERHQVIWTGLDTTAALPTTGLV